MNKQIKAAPGKCNRVTSTVSSLLFHIRKAERIKKAAISNDRTEKRRKTKWQKKGGPGRDERGSFRRK